MKLAFIFNEFALNGRPFNFNFLWDDPRGLTGSDLGVMIVAKEMKKLGHDVSLFTRFNDVIDEWEGIKVYQLDKVRDIITSDFDVVLSWLDPTILRSVPEDTLRICSQQLNDFSYCVFGYDDFVDVYTSPCQMHLDYVSQHTPNKNKWHVIPNGCNPDWYSENKVPGRVIWASSADRGLHWLLQEWHRIKKAVPEAHLKIFYNFNYGPLLEYCEDAELIVQNEFGQRIRYMKEMIKRLEPLGVEMVGSVSRNQMAKEMNEAMVLAYPVSTMSFTEGFSVSILEACASGTVPVIAGADTLESIYGGIVPMVKDPVEHHLPEFNSLVIKALIDSEFHKQTSDRCKDFAKNYTWENVAKQYESLIYSNTKYKARHE